MSNITETTLEIDPSEDWSYAVQSSFSQGHRNGVRVHSLSSDARMLFIYLRSYVGPNSKIPFPGVERICGDLFWNPSTYKKYRRELEEAGYVERVQRRNGGVFRSNGFILKLSPSVKKPSTVKPSAVTPPTVKSPTKMYQSSEEGRPIREADTTGVGSTPGGADSPSQDEPPAAVERPGTKTNVLIEMWKQWYRRFNQKDLTIDSHQKSKLLAFFKAEPTYTSREIMAIALNAWMQAQTDKTEGKEWFWCKERSRLPGDLVNGISSIQQEIGWKRTEGRIQRQFDRAEKWTEDTSMNESA